MICFFDGSRKRCFPAHSAQEDTSRDSCYKKNRAADLRKLAIKNHRSESAARAAFLSQTSSPPAAASSSASNDANLPKDPNVIPDCFPKERRSFCPDDITADLDSEDNLLDYEDPADDSAMGKFLSTVHSRLQLETSSTPQRLGEPAVLDKWLLRMLKSSDWWLRASNAKMLCAKLGLDFGEQSYYCDRRIWLPEEVFGIYPPCVECKDNYAAHAHSWRDNHFGRRITDLQTHYFIVARRYWCKTCTDRAKEAKCAAESMAEAAGLGIPAENLKPAEKPPQYTFMSWDARSLARLPYGYGDEFPAFLT